MVEEPVLSSAIVDEYHDDEGQATREGGREGGRGEGGKEGGKEGRRKRGRGEVGREVGRLMNILYKTHIIFRIALSIIMHLYFSCFVHCTSVDSHVIV